LRISLRLFVPIPASHTESLKQCWSMRQALAALAALDGGAAALGAQPRVVRTLARLLTGAHPPAWEAPPRPPDKLTAHMAATLERRARRPTQACLDMKSCKLPGAPRLHQARDRTCRQYLCRTP